MLKFQSMRPITKALSMFTNAHYRPLPKELKIARSEIDGFGIFAKEDIPAGTKLGMTHVWAMDMWIRTPLGGFINHSNEPNSRGEMHYDYEYETDYRMLITIDDIKEGEEITFFYTLTEYQGVFN